MAVLESRRYFRVKKRQDPCRNHGQYIRKGSLNQLRLPGTPVKALDLIGKNDADYTTALWQENLKWVSFDSGSDGTKQS
jgi:hypothetical protein